MVRKKKNFESLKALDSPAAALTSMEAACSLNMAASLPSDSDLSLPDDGVNSTCSRDSMLVVSELISELTDKVETREISTTRLIYLLDADPSIDLRLLIKDEEEERDVTIFADDLLLDLEDRIASGLISPERLKEFMKVCEAVGWSKTGDKVVGLRAKVTGMKIPESTPPENETLLLELADNLRSGAISRSQMAKLLYPDENSGNNQDLLALANLELSSPASMEARRNLSESPVLQRTLSPTVKNVNINVGIIPVESQPLEMPTSSSSVKFRAPSQILYNPHGLLDPEPVSPSPFKDTGSGSFCPETEVGLLSPKPVLFSDKNSSQRLMAGLPSGPLGRVDSQRKEPASSIGSLKIGAGFPSLGPLLQNPPVWAALDGPSRPIRRKQPQNAWTPRLYTTD